MEHSAQGIVIPTSALTPLTKITQKLFIDAWNRDTNPVACMHKTADPLLRAKLGPKQVLTIQLKGQTKTGCSICYGDGFRAGYLVRNLKTEPHPARPELDTLRSTKSGTRAVHTPSFDTGVIFAWELDQYNDIWLIWEKYSSLKSDDLRFVLNEKFYGEFPHLLISRLLQPKIQVQPDEQNGKEEGDMWQSLLYLEPDFGKDGKSLIPAGNGETTATIVRAFQAAAANQEELFQAIRKRLDRIVLSSQLDTPELEKLVLPYCKTTYFGKYWLNRFMTATGQGSEKNTPKAGRKLPIIELNERIVIIFIRTQGADKERGRSMTNGNINLVLDAIIRANSLARTGGGALISKVIFYGDIRNMDRVQELKNLVAEKKKSGSASTKAAAAAIQDVIGITGPWAADKQDLSGFWTEFQRSEPSMPLQIKYIALFLALQARYGPRLCAIGFRSGYLDLAAFLGIPTFFVDDNSSSLTGTPLNLSLCSNKTKIQSRIGTASQNINSLIRIEFKRKANQEVDREKEETWKLDEPASGKADTPVPIRLAAALYVYMLIKIGEKDFTWQDRVRLLNLPTEDKNPNALVKAFFDAIQAKL